MIKTLVFDLDDTLMDTQKQMTLPLLKEVWSFLQDRGYKLSFEDMMAFRHQHNIEKPHRDFFRRLARRITQTPAESKALAVDMTNHYYSFKGPFTISISKDLRQQLFDWKEQYDLFLVTAGREDRQSAKIAELQIESAFNAILIADKSRAISKKDCFLQILQSQGLSPQESMSIGNRVDLEIREAKLLGMKTCLVLTGEYKDLKPRNSGEEPDFTISHLRELSGILEQDRKQQW